MDSATDVSLVCIDCGALYQQARNAKRKHCACGGRLIDPENPEQNRPRGVRETMAEHEARVKAHLAWLDSLSQDELIAEGEAAKKLLW